VRLLATLALTIAALIGTATPTLTATTSDRMADCLTPTITVLGTTPDGGRIERWTCE